MLEILSRLQFAFTIMFHFLFVPVSIGLILMVAIFETMHWKKRNDIYRQLGDFFGNLFIVSYAIGVVTGVTMSVQFGTNWANFSVFMGQVFGPPLALEALLAFFLEATFTGIWIFRRKQLSPRGRVITAWLIVLGTSISALWIITANGFMQHPVGYAIEDGVLILTSIAELLLNPYTWYMLIHTVTSAYLLGSFIVISIASYKLYNKKTSEKEKAIYSKALVAAAWVGLVAAIALPIIGSSYAAYIGEVQPTKFDAMVGSEREPVNGVEPVGDYEAVIVRFSFLAMVSFGTLFIIIPILILSFKKVFITNTYIQSIMRWLFVLPFIIIQLGWVISEVGRQPYTVYGLYTTSESVSNVPTSQVAFSLVATFILYGLAFILVVHIFKTLLRKSLEATDYNHKFEEDLQ